MEELVEQVKKAKMLKDVHEKAMKELDKLGKMSFMSPEATVVRNYASTGSSRSRGAF